MAARSALRRTLRPVSVMVGLAVAAMMSLILRVGVSAAAWYVHQPFDGLLHRTLSLTAVGAALLLGAYVAARLSGSRALEAALAVGVVALLAEIVSIFLQPLAAPWWSYALDLAVSLGAAAVGGLIVAQSRRETSDADRVNY